MPFEMHRKKTDSDSESEIFDDKPLDLAENHNKRQLPKPVSRNPIQMSMGRRVAAPIFSDNDRPLASLAAELEDEPLAEVKVLKVSLFKKVTCRYLGNL